jgi:hypothetical protein
MSLLTYTSRLQSQHKKAPIAKTTEAFIFNTMSKNRVPRTLG